jgi:hypothetical protein
MSIYIYIYIYIYICVCVCVCVCVVFAHIALLIKTVHLFYYLTIYVSKLPCGTHTKSNWKWIPKYADCGVRKRIQNCCLSVKHMQSSNYLLNGKSNSQYIIHIITTLSVVHWQGWKCEGEGIPFIFPWLVIHRHSDVKVPCSNLTTDKRAEYFSRNY